MPPSTHPSNSVAPNDFNAALADLIRAETEKDARVGKVRSIYARFEAMGCNMRALKLMLQVRKMEPDDGQIMLRDALRYMQWANLQIGEQAQLFSDDGPRPNAEAAKQVQAAEAYNEGHKAGLAGRSVTEHRYTPGTSLHQQFVTGWNDGQRDLAEQMQRDLVEGETLKPEKKARKPKAGEQTAAGKPRGRGGRGKRNGAGAHA